jgi:uncharacterized protein (TIGR00369 family)
MQEVAKYQDCFVCGDKNDAGLKAKFYALEDGSVVSEFIADGRFQGYKNVLHGGILAAMLDEVMIKALLAKGVFAVTAELTVKFKRPVITGQRIKLTGRITQQSRRIAQTSGVATSENGLEVATATAKYIEAKDDLKSILVESVE